MKFEEIFVLDRMETIKLLPREAVLKNAEFRYIGTDHELGVDVFMDESDGSYVGVKEGIE